MLGMRSTEARGHQSWLSLVLVVCLSATQWYSRHGVCNARAAISAQRNLAVSPALFSKNGEGGMICLAQRLADSCLFTNRSRTICQESADDSDLLHEHIDS